MKLTKAQIQQAVESFKLVTVKHALQESTLEFVLFMLQGSPNVDIVNLVGPTGIGKSQLQKRIIGCIQGEAEELMKADSDLVPIIRTHALAAGHKLFDWRSLYRGGLSEVGDPFSDSRKAVPGKQAVVPERFRDAGESRTASELRMRLESEFRDRKVKVWIIDEAQHLVFGGRSGQPGDQFDVLKSIAQSSGVKLLLAGPREMEGGLGSSSQLARRSVTVHYPRYRNDNADHMKTFANVVATLFSKMDVAGYPAVMANLKFFYAGSAGCIGIAKDWLAKAYGLALREQTKDERAVVTREHLQRTRLSLKSMDSIMADIRLEEESVRDVGTDKDFERVVFGYEKKQPPTTPKAPGKRQGKPRAARRVGARAVGPRDKVPTEVDQTEAEYV